MKLQRHQEDRILFMEAGLAEEERESLIAAPFLTIKLLHTATSKSAVFYMVGTDLRGRNAARFVFWVSEPRWKCAAFPEEKFGVRIWRF
jgi:hypothetical protein